MPEARKMGFEVPCPDWQEKRLTQAEAARLLGVCEPTQRLHGLIERYQADRLDALIDKRLEQVSHRRAPVQAGKIGLVDLYRRRP